VWLVDETAIGRDKGLVGQTYDHYFVTALWPIAILINRGRSEGLCWACQIERLNTVEA